MITAEFTILVVGTGCTEEDAFNDACDSFEQCRGEPNNTSIIEDTGKEDC